MDPSIAVSFAMLGALLARDHSLWFYFALLALTALGLALCLLPGIIATRRHHPQRLAIWALTLVSGLLGGVLGGWTWLAWLVALVWACLSRDTLDRWAARAAGTPVGTWRICPACAEAIRVSATKCRYCQTDVATPVP